MSTFRWTAECLLVWGMGNTGRQERKEREKGRIYTGLIRTYMYNICKTKC